MKHSVFSFFSGSGFLDLGFERAGFNVVFVNEINKEFIEAYKYSRRILNIPTPRYNHHQTSIDDFISGDGFKMLSNYIKEEKNLSDSVGFIGGPPCPDFSVAGKNKGKDGENGKLSQSYIDAIKKHQPDWFVFENVKGLWRTKKHREFYEKIKLELNDCGYLVTERLLNSIEFGAPQDRERIIMFGVKTSYRSDLSSFNWESNMPYPGRAAFKYSWPSTHPYGSTPSKPDIPENLTIKWWFDNNDVENHPNANDYFKPRAGLAKFLSVSEGDTSKKSYKRLHRWRYSPTAAYGNNEVHIHPWLARRISAAEALAIQSLPIEFQLPPSMSLSAKFKTIGNGVPFKLSHGLALSIKSYLEI